MPAMPFAQGRQDTAIHEFAEGGLEPRALQLRFQRFPEGPHSAGQWDRQWLGALYSPYIIDIVL